MKLFLLAGQGNRRIQHDAKGRTKICRKRPDRPGKTKRQQKQQEQKKKKTKKTRTKETTGTTGRRRRRTRTARGRRMRRTRRMRGRIRMRRRRRDEEEITSQNASIFPHAPQDSSAQFPCRKCSSICSKARPLSSRMFLATLPT